MVFGQLTFVVRRVAVIGYKGPIYPNEYATFPSDLRTFEGPKRRLNSTLEVRSRPKSRRGEGTIRCSSVQIDPWVQRTKNAKGPALRGAPSKRTLRFSP